MIRFSKEKVLLLHRIMAEATGGSIGLSVADGSMGYNELLQWVIDHRE